MQATMFQPVGGMDRIPAAFTKRLADIIHFDSPVEQIRKTPRACASSIATTRPARRRRSRPTTASAPSRFPSSKTWMPISLRTLNSNQFRHL